MLWQLPAPLRSFAFATCRRYSVTGQRRSASEPLRILFCGSDAFSIASLRALHDAKQEVPGLIDSIDVVHRPAKPTGRGLKKLREGICYMLNPPSNTHII
jgi:methionyl-tRNA formyltransferase